MAVGGLTRQHDSREKITGLDSKGLGQPIDVVDGDVAARLLD